MGLCACDVKRHYFDVGEITMRHVRPILLLLLLLAGGVGTLQVLAADQVRTTETLVYASSTSVSSSVDAPFMVYVGDNLAGITSPVKSLYFSASGMYSGGGSLTVTIDSDAATSQVFTLPAVSQPTPFEVVYKDPSGKINPPSAGSYSYTLNLVPSGVTLTTFGVRMVETHRFAPAACPDGTTQKMKTNDFLVFSSDAAVAAERTDSFTLYLGDNMAGITDPLKSLQFTVVGVYTGGGTVTLSLNSDAATAETFTLPSVSAPTQYELLYTDPTRSISPTSGGSYTYTFTTVPSGVTLYQLSVIARETHRYVPPACGGMPIKGELYSGVFDTTASTTGASYNSLLWKGVLGGPSTDQGHVRFQLAAADCSNGATNPPACTTGSWSFVGGNTCTVSDWFDPGAPDTPYDLQSSSCIAAWNNKRYYRYAVELCSDDCSTAGSYTPRVDDVIVNWSP